jgi:hypothetical protein
VGLGPSPVVRLEGALAHDDSAVTRGQRKRAAANARLCTELPRLHRQEPVKRRRSEPKGKAAPQQVNLIRRPTGADGQLALTLWRTSTDRLGAVSVLRHRTFPTSCPATGQSRNGRRFSARPSAARRWGALTPALASACPCTDCGRACGERPPVPGRSPHRRSEGAL